METLKIFFRKTHYFWVISRIILILLFLTVLLNQTNANNISFWIVGLILTVYIICMICLSILGFIKKEAPKVIKIFTGGFSIFFGALLIYLLLFIFNQNFIILTFFLPIWLIFHGAWEIINKVKVTDVGLKN